MDQKRMCFYTLTRVTPLDWKKLSTLEFLILKRNLEYGLNRTSLDNIERNTLMKNWNILDNSCGLTYDNQQGGIKSISPCRMGLIFSS